MSTNISLNGSTYSIPSEGDSNWSTNVSSYLIALSTGVLSKSGGTFTLTSEVDFGATYGLKSTYFKSRATNPASSGQLRLGNAESVKWRNAANNADLDLTVNASNALQYNSSNVIIAGNASIVNADVNASAAIAYSKLNLATSIVDADINASAAIAYSKLNIANNDLTIAKTNGLQTALDGKIANTLTTTAGDMIYASSANTPARLPIGSSGQVLKTVAGVPTWATFSGGINYLSSNPDAEGGTTGWATYADAAGTSPVDGV